MPKYILTRKSLQKIEDDELMHWKYIKRKMVKGKWKYWYDLDSLKKDVKSTVSTVADKTRKMVSSGQKTIQKYATTTLNKVSNDVKKITDKAKENTHKYVAKVPTGDNEYRYFYSEESYQAYLKGKNAVDKVLNTDINATPSDVTKANAKGFLANVLNSGFGQAVYNLVAPALAAIQVALTTPKSFTELNKTTGDQSNDEHQLAINPDFSPFTHDYSQNCTFCSAAYDMRKRGYDVEASPISLAEGYVLDDVLSWYKDPQAVSKSTIENFHREKALKNPKEALTEKEMLSKALKSNGEGSRGHLILYWKGGGAHDVIWEVENDEVVLRDCQTGLIERTFSTLDAVADYTYIRTDNLEPTEDILRAVRNKKRG